MIRRVSRGVVYDVPSPTHARGHADSESGARHPTCLRGVRRQFARHFGRSPADLGPEEIRAFQVYLIRERHLAPSTLIVAVAALRFLYTVTLKQSWSVDVVVPAPKIIRPLPVVLSPAEVVHF